MQLGACIMQARCFWKFVWDGKFVKDNYRDRHIGSFKHKFLKI